MSRLALVFIALAYHFSHIVLGRAREGFIDVLPPRTRVPMALLAAAAILLGVWLPTPVRDLIEHAMQSIRP